MKAAPSINPSRMTEYTMHGRGAGGWFLTSGIQEPNGGVARFYRADLGCNRAISTEITGYTASALAYLHSVTGDDAYLDRARHTAHFLARHAWDADADNFPFEYGEGAESKMYFFDCGIIVRGLAGRLAAEGANKASGPSAARTGGRLLPGDDSRFRDAERDPSDSRASGQDAGGTRLALVSPTPGAAISSSRRWRGAISLEINGEAEF